VRAVIPANPLLGFTVTGHPVSLLRLGAVDAAQLASKLTTEDMVRAPGAAMRPPRAPARERPAAVQVADMVVRCEFFHRVVFPEATHRGGACPHLRTCRARTVPTCGRFAQAAAASSTRRLLS
jgi:hypothetical protein